MLYLISTPIGNLGDLSYRAVETLKKSDVILCEDTRHSRILLDHYQIAVPLRSFHKFNQNSQIAPIIDELKEGKTLSLISDAGTPLIADPGHELVAACYKEKILVTAIPGASALISALLLSALPPLPFQFIGFLPKSEGERNALLSHALLYTGTTIAYETPHRIEATLRHLLRLSPTRHLCIARELTKKFEEILKGTATELLSHLETHPPRGEMVLLISPSEESSPYDHLSLEELIPTLQQIFHSTPKEALKLAAELRHMPKRELYRMVHGP